MDPLGEEARVEVQRPPVRADQRIPAVGLVGVERADQAGHLRDDLGQRQAGRQDQVQGAVAGRDRHADEVGRLRVRAHQSVTRIGRSVAGPLASPRSPRVAAARGMLTASADHAVGRLSLVDPLVLRDEGQVVRALAVTVATGTGAAGQHGTAAARGATAPGDLGAAGLAQAPAPPAPERPPAAAPLAAARPPAPLAPVARPPAPPWPPTTVPDGPPRPATPRPEPPRPEAPPTPPRPATPFWPARRLVLHRRHQHHGRHHRRPRRERSRRAHR